MAGLYDTVAEYDEAIADTRIAIKRAKRVGHRHSSDSGGSSRETEEISLKDLKEDLRDLQREKARLQGKPSAAAAGVSF